MVTGADRSAHRRFSAAVLAVALLASCSSGGDGGDGGDEGAAPDETVVAADTTAPTPTFAPREPGPLDEVLELAGIPIVPAPGAEPIAGGEGSAVILTSWQVDNMAGEMEAGNGFLGAELDDLLGAPGGLPFSYFLAGWLAGESTPVAAAAADLMGERDWTQAPALVFPNVVLTLFVADAARAAASDHAPAEDGEAAVTVDGLPVELISFDAWPAQAAGPCTTIQSFAKEALHTLFEVLEVPPGDGFLGFVAAVWNTAVGIAEGIVTVLASEIVAEVVAVLRGAFFVLGALNQIASALKPWAITVTAVPPATDFALGDAPDVENTFIASVNTGVPPWPDWIVDCASSVGVTLFDSSSAAGVPVTWSSHGIPELGEIVATDDVLRPNNAARFDWISGRERSDKGPELRDLVSVRVRVEPDQREPWQEMVDGIVHAALADIPTIAKGAVLPLTDAFTDAVFDKFAVLTAIDGAASTTTFRHVQLACVVGEWVSQEYAVPNEDLVATGGQGVVVTVDKDNGVIWDFSAMTPLAMPQSFFTTTYDDKGVARGSYDAEEVDGTGTWNPTWDVSGMQSSINAIPGAPSPLLGVYAMMTNGNYECSDEALVFVTHNGVGEQIVVGFTRVPD